MNRNNNNFDCNNLFGNLFNELSKMEHDPMIINPFGFHIKADYYEFDDRAVLELDLPGFKKENIKVSPEGNTISIKATRELSSEKAVVRERFENEVSRTFKFPFNIDAENIKAKLEDGVLTLTVPKKEANKIVINIE